MRSTARNQSCELVLTTLGKLAVCRQSAEVKLTSKEKAFLTVLVAHPNGVSRDKLAGILWANRPPKNARHSLSQAIHTARISLPEIEITADAEIVKLTGTIRWDVNLLLKACASGQGYKSVRMYAGEFLVGLPEIGHEFEDWRSSIQTKVVNALRSAVSAEINDLCIQGDFNEAHKILTAFTKRLGDDICEDVIPSSVRKTITMVVTESPSEELAFVGRKAELHALHRGLVASSRGLTIAAVTGQPGIGKSALCARFVRGAVAQGATVMYCKAYPADRNVGYRSLLTALNGLTEAREQIASVGEPWQTVIQSLSDPKSAKKAQPGADVQKQEFVFEAFTRVLHRVAESRSLILWIDDVQWADPSTISFLQYLNTRRQKLKSCVVLSLRDAAIRDSEVNNLLESADSLVHVGRLSRSEVASLVGCLPRNKRQEISRELWRLTGGHPYLISEILRSLPLKGERWSARGIRDVASNSISQLIATKIESLEAGAKALLNALAAFNKPVSTGLIRKVVALRRGDFMTALDTLLERNLVRDTSGTLTCAHDIIREAVYLRLSCTQKQLLHRFCANALEKSGATPREVIDHLLIARARKRAYLAALRAAAESRKDRAYKETDYCLSVVGRVSGSVRKRSAISWRRALNAFEAGNFSASQRHLSALDAVPNLSHSLQARVRELRLRNGRLSGAMRPDAIMSEARALAAVTDTKELVDIHSQALRSCLHVILATGGTTEDVKTLLAAFTQVSEKYPGTAAELLALGGSTRLQIWLGHPDSAEALMTRALDSIATCRSAFVRNEVFLNAGTMKYFNGELHAAKELYLRALQEADEIFSMRRRTVALINLSAVYLDLGDYENATDMLDQIIREGSSNGVAGPEIALAYANYTLLHVDKGELELAEQRAKECLQLGQSIEHCMTMAIPLAVLGICALARGSIAEARKCRQAILDIKEASLFDDVLVIEQFLRRLSELERDYEGARRRLESRLANSSRYNVCCRTGLHLELARVYIHTDPRAAFGIATEQLGIAMRIGARSLIEEAESIVARARLKLTA